MKPFKVRISKGKIKVIGEEKSISLDRLKEKAESIKKIFRNALIEIHGEVEDSKKVELVEKTLIFLDSKNLEGKLNDAYVIIEEEKRSPNLYLAILGKKITLATWSDYFLSKAEGLSKLLQTIMDNVKFDDSFNLKLSDEVDVDALRKILAEIGKITLYEIDVRHPSLELLKMVLKKYPEVRYIRIRKTKNESLRFQRSIALLEFEVEKADKILNQLEGLRQITDKLEFFETETLECLDLVSKIIQEKNDIEGLSIITKENELVIEILKKGLKEAITAKLCR